MLLLWLGTVGLLTAKELPPREEVKVLSPAYTRYLEVKEKTEKLKAAEDFAGLDGLAEELRQSRETLQSGTWLLTEFYKSAVESPQNDHAKAEAAMQFYQKWADERPGSVTAQICLAAAYTSYAWVAPGAAGPAR